MTFHYQNCTCPEHYRECEICGLAYPAACSCPVEEEEEEEEAEASH